MILATDVDYRDEIAIAAGVLFDDWTSESESAIKTVQVSNFGEYIPGEFYKRELPCIKALLETVDSPIDLIIVDGFVTLGPDRKPGLGYRLWETLNKSVPVIGVAKSSFQNTRSECEISRGRSEKPLYVTAVGMSLEDAQKGIKTMHGQYRLPTMLKLVDRICRA